MANEKQRIFKHDNNINSKSTNIQKKKKPNLYNNVYSNKKTMTDKAENISIFQIIKFNVFKCCLKIILVMNEKKKKIHFICTFLWCLIPLDIDSKSSKENKSNKLEHK